MPLGNNGIILPRLGKVYPQIKGKVLSILSTNSLRLPINLEINNQNIEYFITQNSFPTGFHESIPDCRSCDSPRTVHPECNPFPVPRGDHYYPEVNITSGERMCFPFMRSLPGQQQLGKRIIIKPSTKKKLY